MIYGYKLSILFEANAKIKRTTPPRNTNAEKVIRGHDVDNSKIDITSRAPGYLSLLSSFRNAEGDIGRVLKFWLRRESSMRRH